MLSALARSVQMVYAALTLKMLFSVALAIIKIINICFKQHAGKCDLKKLKC